jgi:23S rRNA (uracil747-C5)-methyltransferase
LQNSLTTLAVVSVNIQPIAMAIVEGKEEIILTSQTRLMMLINELSLFIQPQSFFQTNDAVAAALYRQAQDWIYEIQPSALWDLFCGVGGFALHAAQVMRGAVTGIELSEQAIASAQASAQLLIKTNNIEFRAVSSDDFAFVQTDVPECVIVNPPRRGIGAALCAFLNDANDIQWIIYSSCNPKSLTQDLSRLTLFTPIKARVFDMFPHTHHAEVLVLLKRV